MKLCFAALSTLVPLVLGQDSQLVWTIHDFDFHASYIFTTPAHQNSWGYVNFTISNTIAPYKSFCTASSNQLSDFFYGTTAYACKPADEAPIGAASNFRFSRPSSTIVLEETVPTPEEYVTRFGTTKLNLTCTDTGTVVNENWEIGQIYSTRDVKCVSPVVTVDPN